MTHGEFLNVGQIPIMLVKSPYADQLRDRFTWIEKVVSRVCGSVM
jgi:hypothetical protein